MQDLLAMTALQLASKSDTTNKEGVDLSIVKEIEDKLQSLSDDLD